MLRFAAAVLAHERELSGSAKEMLTCTKQLSIIKLGSTSTCKQSQGASSFLLSFGINMKVTALSEVQSARELSGQKKPVKHTWKLRWETNWIIDDLFGHSGPTEWACAWRMVQDLLPIPSSGLSCLAKGNGSMPQFLQQKNKVKCHFLSLCRGGAFRGQPQFKTLPRFLDRRCYVSARN